MAIFEETHKQQNEKRVTCQFDYNNCFCFVMQQVCVKPNRCSINLCGHEIMKGIERLP